MKIIIPLFGVMLVAFSCNTKSKVLNEDYKAIYIETRRDLIQLNDNLYMHRHDYSQILFSYHDSVFKISRENGKEKYAYLKMNQQNLDSLNAIFNKYNKTNLKEQLSLRKKNGNGHYCFGQGYVLFQKNNEHKFVLFHPHDFIKKLGRIRYKEVNISKRKFPNVYQTIQNTFNSKIWDYVMSDDYYYRRDRTFKMNGINHVHKFWDTTQNIQQ